jgi:hypothetical protein
METPPLFKIVGLPCDRNRGSHRVVESIIVHGRTLQVTDSRIDLDILSLDIQALFPQRKRCVVVSG